MADAQDNIQATDDYASDLSVKEIITFFKLRKRRLLLRAGISFVLMLLAFLLLYAFTPRNATWSRNITLLLPQNDNLPVYPSGRAFSTSDLLTPSVLREVYNANNLKGRIDFADFMSSFFMSDSNMEKARLDAEYREKMNKRNISVIDLQNLEHEYKQKLQSLASEQLAISMKPETPLSRIEITKILNSIPEAWFKIFSKLEAREFPQIDMNGMQQEIVKVSQQPGRLILLEKTRVYCNKLLAVCALLNEMQQGKNISLPSGEFLGDIQQQLRDIDQYQIAVFRQYVLMNPAYQGTFDKIFIYSKLKAIEQELIKINKKYEGALASFNMLQPQKPSHATKNAGTGKTAETPVTFQLDNSFFTQFAEMIRNDINNKLRALYAKKTIEYADERASLEADQAYFQNLLGSVTETKSGKDIPALNPEQFNAMLKEMYSGLFATGNKVVQFRDQILKDYLSSRQFYTPVGNVQYQSDFSLPVKRIMLGLFALWLFVNAVWAVIDFCILNTKGLLRRES